MYLQSEQNKFLYALKVGGACSCSMHNVPINSSIVHLIPSYDPALKSQFLFEIPEKI